MSKLFWPIVSFGDHWQSLFMLLVVLSYRLVGVDKK